MGKYRRYSSYKNSDIEWLGKVPEHWTTQRMKFSALINPPKTLASNIDKSSIVQFLPMEVVQEDGTFSTNEMRLLSEVYTGYTYCEEGDVILAKITPCYENGKGALLKGLKTKIAFGSTEFHVIRPKTLLGKYLWYISRTHPFRNLGESEMKGSVGQQRVPDSFIKNFRVPVPSKQEQESIAFFLDRKTSRIDALITKKTRFIELLKEKRQALITHAVTKGLDPNIKMKDSGVEWIDEVPEHWEIRKLKFNFLQITQKSTHQINRIALENIESKTGRFIETNSEFEGDGIGFEKNDILFGKLRPYLAKVYLAEIAGEAVGDLFIIRPKKQIHPLFAKYLLLSRDFIDIVNSSTYGAKMPRVSWDFFSDIPIPTPNKIEQEAIAKYLDHETARIDSLISKTEQSISLLKERRSALITAAVTGQIDVRDAV